MQDNVYAIGGRGAWTGDDLAATVLDNVGIGVDAGLPDTARFLSGVTKLIRRRLTAQDAPADPERLAIFLLEPNAHARVSSSSPKRVPMLDNGRTAVAGRLWFVSAVVLTGRFLELDGDDDDAAFRVVTDELNLGGVPAIVYDPRTRPISLRFYPKGLNDPESCDPLEVTTDVSLQRIYEAIDQVYYACLITPGIQGRTGKLWQDAAHWRPSTQAEYVIQLLLRAGLAAAFPGCTVRHEQTVAPGRLDIQIEESDPSERSRVTRHALLELKVLRSYGSDGSAVSDREICDWVESGVQQAASYREDIGSREAALCCFDMRRRHTGEKCFAHVLELAKELRVDLRHWFLFASSKAYRRFSARGC